MSEQSQKQIQKQDHDSYQARRLIFHVKANIWKNFNSYNLRNQVNDAFFQKKNISDLVIASITRSKTGFSVVLTTMPTYNADFLLEKQQIWENIFSQNLKFIEKSTQWHKIIIHEVSIMLFSTSDNLFILKNEIEIFNSELKLLRDSS